MPMGVWALSSASRLSTLAPMTVTLPPEAVEMPSAMQGLPLRRRMDDGGST